MVASATLTRSPSSALVLRAAAKRVRKRSDARSSLLGFTCHMMPEYRVGDVHRRIAEAVEWAISTRGARLIVTVPPRHGKSTIISEHLPPYVLGQHPDWRIIGVSHTQQLANQFSRQSRNKIRDDRYPYRGVEVTEEKWVQLAKDQANVLTWGIEGHRGGYVAAGIGGPITGHGANLLLIDDPVKSREEADSVTQRERIWEWYRGTARTRLQSGGRIILVMTRWHDDDLAGRLIASAPGRWRVLHLPAIDAAGKALWPEEFPLSELLDIKADVGTRDWDAQYQGEPIAEAGGILKPGDFFEYDYLPAHATQYIQFWDTAWKTADRHDYSVCLTAAISPANPTHAYIVDIWREKVEYPQLQQRYRAQVARWQPAYTDIEDAQSGTALLQWARQNPGPPAIARPATTSKIENANLAAPHLEAGRVGLPRSAHWKEDFLLEVKGFPLIKHDDQVDTLTAMVRRVFAAGGMGARQSNYRDDIDDEDEEDERW